LSSEPDLAGRQAYGFVPHMMRKLISPHERANRHCNATRRRERILQARQQSLDQRLQALPGQLHSLLTWSDCGLRLKAVPKWSRVREELCSLQRSLVKDPPSPFGWLTIQRAETMAKAPAKRSGADGIHAGGDADHRDQVEARGEETKACSA
jgi:hypothetical protein